MFNILIILLQQETIIFANLQIISFKRNKQDDTVLCLFAYINAFYTRTYVDD